jgi:hypothetical protein
MNVTDTKPAADAVQGEHGAPTIVLDPTQKLGRGPVIGLIVLGLLLGAAILAGIHSRAHAEKQLTAETTQDSIMAVAVTTPSRGADALEITLPADTQAFIDTPIYARTSGYLRRWYADIGAHVHQGEVLAVIETPELDQQVQQAQADLSTAQANLNIAQITAERPERQDVRVGLGAGKCTAAATDAGFRKGLCTVRRRDYGAQRGCRLAHPGRRQRLPESGIVPHGRHRQASSLCAGSRSVCGQRAQWRSGCRDHRRESK